MSKPIINYIDLISQRPFDVPLSYFITLINETMIFMKSDDFDYEVYEEVINMMHAASIVMKITSHKDHVRLARFLSNYGYSDEISLRDYIYNDPKLSRFVRLKSIEYDDNVLSIWCGDRKDGGDTNTIEKTYSSYRSYIEQII